MNNQPPTTQLNLYLIFQKSWKIFWTYSNQFFIVAATITALSLLATYIGGGLTAVKIDLGLLDPLTPTEEFQSISRSIIAIVLQLATAIFITLGGALLIRIMHHQSTNLGREIQALLPQTFPLLIASFLGSLAILGGSFLLVIPGIMFAVWFMFVPCTVVIEKLSPIEALQKSRRLSKGRFWSVLLIAAFSFILFVTLAMIVGSVAVIGPLAIDILLWPFTVAYLYIFYQELVQGHATSHSAN